MVSEQKIPSNIQYSTGIKMYEILIIESRMVLKKKDDTSILCHQIVISSSNAIVVALMLCSMKLPDYAMKRQECPHTHR